MIIDRQAKTCLFFLQKIIGYKPISLDYILSLNYEYIKYMNYSDTKIIWKTPRDIEFEREESIKMRSKLNTNE